MPKIVDLLNEKLQRALALATPKSQEEPDDIMAMAYLHGVLTLFEQVTRVIRTEEIGCIWHLFDILWHKVPYAQHMALRLITLDIIENLSYIYKPSATQANPEEPPSLLAQTQNFIQYVVKSL